MFNALKKVLHGYKTPTKHELLWDLKQTEFTPDVARLEEYEFQFLFCPDETMRGGKDYPLIEDSAFIGHAFTRKSYEFWLKDLGEFSFGIPLEETPTSGIIGNWPKPHKIKGEIHLIRPHQFFALDMKRMNGVQFIRKRVHLLLPSRQVLWLKDPDISGYHPSAVKVFNGRTEDTYYEKDSIVTSNERVDIVKAWMYVGRPEFWDNQLDAGYTGHKSVHTYQSKKIWLGEYYQYRIK